MYKDWVPSLVANPLISDSFTSSLREGKDSDGNSLNSHDLRDIVNPDSKPQPLKGTCFHE